MEYFGPVSLPLFHSETNDDEEIRLFEAQHKLANEKTKLGHKCVVGKNQKAEKCIFKCCNHRMAQWIWKDCY